MSFSLGKRFENLIIIALKRQCAKKSFPDRFYSNYINKIYKSFTVLVTNTSIAVFFYTGTKFCEPTS